MPPWRTRIDSLLPDARLAVLQFFLDHNVAASVGRVLQQAGHEVVFLADVLPQDAEDKLVAAVAEQRGAVIVSHDRDFRQLAPRIGIGRAQYRKLSRVALTCTEPQAAGHVRTALALIEAEWTVAQAARDQRMIIEIGSSYIRTNR